MITEITLTWLLGALGGSMLFFAVAVAPTVFRVLPVEQGGAFLRRFFPRYYLWGFMVALLCTLTAVLGSAGIVTAATCASVATLFVYARQLLMPRINRARDRELAGDAAAAVQFRRLHLQSVVINGAQLLLIIGLSVLLATNQAGFSR